LDENWHKLENERLATQIRASIKHLLESKTLKIKSRLEKSFGKTKLRNK